MTQPCDKDAPALQYPATPTELQPTAYRPVMGLPFHVNHLGILGGDQSTSRAKGPRNNSAAIERRRLHGPEQRGRRVELGGLGGQRIVCAGRHGGLACEFAFASMPVGDQSRYVRSR